MFMLAKAASNQLIDHKSHPMPALLIVIMNAFIFNTRHVVVVQIGWSMAISFI